MSLCFILTIRWKYKWLKELLGTEERRCHWLRRVKEEVSFELVPFAKLFLSGSGAFTVSVIVSREERPRLFVTFNSNLYTPSTRFVTSVTAEWGETIRNWEGPEIFLHWYFKDGCDWDCDLPKRGNNSNTSNFKTCLKGFKDVLWNKGRKSRIFGLAITKIRVTGHVVKLRVMCEQ